MPLSGQLSCAAFHSNGTTVSVGNTEGIIQHLDLTKIAEPPSLLEGHAPLAVNFIDTISNDATEKVLFGDTEFQKELPS